MLSWLFFLQILSGYCQLIPLVESVVLSIVLVSSTIRRSSLTEISRLVTFHLALVSSSCFSSFALALSLAAAVLRRNSGLTSRLFCPFRIIFTLSLDWSMRLFDCDAVNADLSKCSLSKRSDSFRNLSLTILNSVLGNRPKCASNGDNFIVFCLFHLRSLIIVLKFMTLKKVNFTSLRPFFWNFFNFFFQKVPSQNLRFLF